MKVRLQPNRTAIAEIPESKFKGLNIEKTPSWLASYKTDESSIERLYRWGYMYNGWSECEKALTFLEKADKINPNFNMSSMTDIVFLLLIFFMITSTLVTTSALDILLPKASGKTENKKSTSISITKNLTFYIDNKKVSEAGLEQELLTLLAGKDSPTIVLRAEEGVPIEKAVKIMDIANRNRFKVILAVRPK